MQRGSRARFTLGHQQWWPVDATRRLGPLWRNATRNRALELLPTAAEIDANRLRRGAQRHPAYRFYLLSQSPLLRCLSQRAA